MTSHAPADDLDRPAAHTATLPKGLEERTFRRGYGTYDAAIDKIGRNEYVRILQTALEAGYRHIDTAQVYDTEEHVAAAVDQSGLAEEEVFVATKLSWDNLGYDDAITTARESRERLGVETIDLLYVHVPYKTYDPDETLPALDHLIADGVIDRIGLSNFLPGMLENAIDRLDSPVFAHQIEMHPLLRQEDLHALAVEHSHWLVAFSPYMQGVIREIAELKQIAEKHGVTPFEVSLAWLLSKSNVAVLSHSKSKAHMR